MMMKRLAISGALLLLMVSCRNNDSATVSIQQDERIPVKVARSETREYTPYTELSGTAYADREANLGAALPGRVEKIYFPAGSRVNKGELLVSMSAELFTQALVEYTTIEKDFERVSRLSEKESVSRQDYDHVKAMYDAAKAKVEMMRKNAEIVAPFSGTITEYMVQEGENYFFNFNLDPGYSSTSGILRLMKLDPIQVAVEVNEKELSGLRLGQKALVTFDATRDSIFTGTVSAIKPVLSSLTHTSTVKIRVSNGSGLLKPGMFAHVRVIMNPVRAVCVPAAAVYRQPGASDDYLFVAENGKVSRIRCEKLWTDNTWVAVRGINDGIEVVTSGREKLHDGSLIDIK